MLCTALSAFRLSAFLTTTVMLYSDAPCAMATTFTDACASASKSIAETPGVWHMFLPTAASTAQSSTVEISLMRPAAMAFSKRADSARLAASASCERTAKQMECSEDAWLIITTLHPACFTVSNTALAVPGTPTIPVPSTLIKHTSSMVARPVMKFTSPLEVSTDGTQPSSSDTTQASLMDVPGAAWLK